MTARMHLIHDDGSPRDSGPGIPFPELLVKLVSRFL